MVFPDLRAPRVAAAAPPQTKPPPPATRYAKNMRSRVDEVVFGRDLDFSGLSAAEGGGSDDAAEVLDDEDARWQRRRELHATAYAPQMRSSVDEVVFGRDLDFSIAADEADGVVGEDGGAAAAAAAVGRTGRERTEHEARHFHGRRVLVHNDRLPSP